MLPFPLLYLKLGAITACIISVLALYWWVGGAFKERDRLRIADGIKTSQIAQYQQMIVTNIKLNEDINNAIAKIRVTSNNYIEAIDTGELPVVVDGDRVQLVIAGVLSEVPSMPIFSNSSTNSTKSLP